MLGVEGKNKTEILYFTELEKRQEKYHFKFHRTNDTDPIKIITNISKEAKKAGVNKNKGDIIGAVFDIDVNKDKYSTAEQVESLAFQKSVELYTSNPCFELWYILHFKYSTKQYISSAELINELKKIIPDYHKNECYISILENNTFKAIENAKKISEYSCKNYGRKSMINNPNTDVYKIVELLLK